MDLADKLRIAPGDRFHDEEFLDGVYAEIDDLTDADLRDEARFDLTNRLVEEWLLEEAERTARSLEGWRIEQTWLIGKVAERLGQLGQRDYAVKLLKKAMPTARTAGTDETIRAEALARLGRNLQALGETEQALDLWTEAVKRAQTAETRGDVDASSVLWEVSETLALAGHWARAGQVADAIKNAAKRDRAISRLKKMHDAYSKVHK